MTNSGKVTSAFREGAFRLRIAWVFALQLLVVVIVSVMGIYNVAPLSAVLAVIAITSAVAWMAARRQWLPVSALASLVNNWSESQPDIDALLPERLPPRTDADVASLTRGLHRFASRIAGYNQRERNFTRDASHELRSPLTVIKMSSDMLAEEDNLSDFGKRSVLRIQRSTREMETLVETLLILAREADPGIDGERFVVNDVLLQELESARELLCGSPVELQLEQPARFALHGSRRVFSVLVWQLIRNACQQTEQGQVVITVFPGMVAFTNHATADGVPRSTGPVRVHGVDRHGFELAIAQRITDRFHWALELQTRVGQENVARLRFPHPLPADALAEQLA
jgi:two-component system sensor histidine kinase QseC